MRRRRYLAGVTIGLTAISGCLNFTTSSDDGTTDDTDTGTDAPEFEVDEGAPGTFVLLRQQPQAPNGVVVADEFEIAVVLGNAGGEPVTGEVSVELRPPNDDEAAQTATVVVDADNEIPSGAARFLTTGPFEATVAGDWELTAGPAIDRVHSDYDGTVEVEARSDD